MLKSVESNDVATNGVLLKNPVKLPKLQAGAIETILGDVERFKKGYREYCSVRHRYVFATSLIDDGRFPDPLFLLHNFVPSQAQIDTNIKDVEQRQKLRTEALAHGQALKNQLTFQLIDKGILKNPESTEFKKQSKDAQREQTQAIEGAKQEVLRQNIEDPLIQNLLDIGWEIEEVGEVALIQRLSNLTDTERLAEWRGWMTRSLSDLYLGPMRVFGNGPIDTTVYDILDRLPKQVFDDAYAVVTNLIRNRIEMDFKQHITDAGINEGLVELERFVPTIEDPLKRKFAEEILDTFLGFATKPHPRFNERIMVNGVEKEFPSMDQIAFAHYGNHPPTIEVDDPDNPGKKKEVLLRRTGTRLLRGKTGRGKTGGLLLAYKESDAKAGLIITPAAGKATWISEAKKLLKGPSQLFVIDRVKDFAEATQLINDPRSPIELACLSMEWLGTTDQVEQRQVLEEAIRMIEQTDMDGGIIDEIDRLTNYGAVQAKTTIRLIEKLRENYAAHHPDGAFDAPVFGATATPIHTSLEDLNVPMSILYTDEFAPVARPGADPRPTFSDKVLNNPNAAYTILTGERRMYRWDHATGIQEYELEARRLEPSPFEEYLYDFIAENAKVTGLELYMLLTDMLENPALIRAEMRARAKDVIPELDEQQAVSQLRGVTLEWKKQRDVGTPEAEDDFLNVDKLITLGVRDVVLAAFFDRKYRGIDRLIDQITKDTDDPVLQDLGRFWQKNELSTKYKALKRDLIVSHSERVDEHGVVYLTKAVIVIEDKLQGRTKKVEQKRINGEEIYTPEELEELNSNLLVDQVARWLSEAGLLERENMLIVDGSVKIGPQRDEAITEWKENPEIRQLFLGGKAASRSRDFVVTHVIDQKGRIFDKLNSYHLGSFWYHAFGEQVGGRYRRQGQTLPANDSVYVLEGLIDEEKLHKVEYTRLLDGMALAGLKLTKKEWELYRSRTHLDGMQVRSRNSREQFLSKFLAYVSGRDIGVDEVREKLANIDPKTGLSDALRFAEAFYDNGNDRYRASGHNAGLVADVFKKRGYSKTHKGLSIGAGTLLFQRISGLGVDNVDINPHMMEVGWDEASKHGGRMIVAEVPGLSEEEFPDESYDFIDNAFTLNWSKLGKFDGDTVHSQRAKILAEMNRLLRRKEGDTPGGTFVLTVPKSAFDEETFGKFAQTLEQHFGFTIDPFNSGKAFGRNRMSERHRISWCITAERTGDVQIVGLDLRSLMFARDIESHIVDPRGKKGLLDGSSSILDIAPIKQSFSEYEFENPLRRRGEIILPKTNGHTPVGTVSAMIVVSTPVEDQNGQEGVEDIVPVVSDITPVVPVDSLGAGDFQGGKPVPDEKIDTIDTSLKSVAYQPEQILSVSDLPTDAMSVVDSNGDASNANGSRKYEGVTFYTSLDELSGPDMDFYIRELVRPVYKILGGWDEAEEFCIQQIGVLQDRIRREITKQNRIFLRREGRLTTYVEQRATAYGIIINSAHKDSPNGSK